MNRQRTVSFDLFCPTLRHGRLIPQGKKIIYETFEPFNQIVLPIEMADLIALSGGRFNMREIIEKIYQRQGYVHFRSIFETVHRLQQEGFFENGEELAPPDASSLPQLQSALTEKLTWDFPLFRRISNDFKAPLAFHILATVVIVFGLLSALVVPHPTDPIYLSLSHGSFFEGVLLSWLCLSLMVSFKHLLKGAFLLFLTGKVYNTGLSIKPWSLHLQVGNESQFLIQSKAMLTLYHAALVLSPFCFLSISSFGLGDESAMRVAILALVYCFWQLNPFSQSQLTQFFRNYFDLDGRLQVANYFSDNSILHLLDPYQENSAQKSQLLFRWIHIAWTGGGLAIYSWLALRHLSVPQLISEAASAEEYIAGSLALIVLVGIWNYLLTKAVRSIYFIFFARPLQKALSLLHTVKARRIASPNRREIFEKVMDLPLLNNLAEDFIHRVIDQSEVLAFEQGSLVIREGERAEHFFVLLSGAIEISKMSQNGRRWMANIFPVSIFGESALSGDQHRHADAVVTQSALVLKIPAQLIRELAHDTQYIRDLESFQGAIVVNQFFHSAPMFRSLPHEVTEMLMNRSKLHYCSSDEVIFEQGDQGDRFYMILRGSVEVHMNGVNVKKIRQGGFFGEIAVIAAIPRTATIKTAEPTILLSIHVDAFWEILVQHMELALFIESVGEQRFKEGVRMFHNETKTPDAA